MGRFNKTSDQLGEFFFRRGFSRARSENYRGTRNDLAWLFFLLGDSRKIAGSVSETRHEKKSGRDLDEAD